jgi:molybdopterin molybdotransferase
MTDWNLIPLEHARRIAVACAEKMLRHSELVDFQKALGRIAAENIINPEDNPAFDRSTVDGYALRAGETATASTVAPAVFELVGEVRMGCLAGLRVQPGQAVRTPTGGMLPAGADTVVMQEYTRRTVDGQLQVFRPSVAGQNIILRGDDAPAGAVVIPAGRRIGVPDVGVLASCGLTQVAVLKRPVATIITTGDEVVAPGSSLKPGQIRDVNSFTLSSLAAAAGCETHLAERIFDSCSELSATLRNALRESDLILVSGGSSVGDRDFTAAAIAALPDVEILFHGIALKPGKPTLLARCGNTMIFGVPGHVVAAMTVFQEIVAPALAALQGMSWPPCRIAVRGKLGAPLRPDRERDEIFRVQLEKKGDDLIVWPLPAKSGLITVMTRAHGMVYTQAGQPELMAGDEVEAQVLPERLNGICQGVLR